MNFPQPFSAVLLVGGKSSRMGRDKAELCVAGEPLWQRQLHKLAVLGASEVLISGRPEGPYAAAARRVIADRVSGLGPLGGLDASLREIATDWMLVLAVDLVDVSVEFLSQLVAHATAEGIGLVPTHSDWFQPLAAIYPRAALPVLEACIAGHDHSLRRFVRAAEEAGLVRRYEIGADELAAFRNLNTPADVDDWKARSGGA